MWYEIDFDKLGKERVPSFLRKPILLAFLNAVVTQVGNLHYDWKQKRLEQWYKLSHTGQVCFLQKVLNDTCDPDPIVGRRIYIRDGNAFPRKYIYTGAENKPVFIGKMFIYRNAEYLSTGADFIVFAPQEIIDTKINELNTHILFYKLASKRYQIRPI